MCIITTRLDRCEIGCGECLVFLLDSRCDKLLLLCPSCHGIWDLSLFTNENPRLYVARDFNDGDLCSPQVSRITKEWEEECVFPGPDDAAFYLIRVRALLGNKLKEDEREPG